MSFMVWGLIFRFHINFCEWSKKGVQFYSFACVYPVCPKLFIGKTPFPMVCSSILVKLSWPDMHEFMSRLSILFQESIGPFLCQ